MKKLLKLALAITLLAAFAGPSTAQQKAEEKRQPTPAGRVEQAEEADRAEQIRYTQCVSAALKEAEQKRQELVRKGGNPETERAIFSLWHGKKKTCRDCPSS
jgi:hypothetical protein